MTVAFWNNIINFNRTENDLKSVRVVLKEMLSLCAAVNVNSQLSDLLLLVM